MIRGWVQNISRSSSTFYRVFVYCTISIDSAWGVTCDQVDEILTLSNVGVTWDKV